MNMKLSMSPGTVVHQSLYTSTVEPGVGLASSEVTLTYLTIGDIHILTAHIRQTHKGDYSVNKSRYCSVQLETIMLKYPIQN